MKITEMNNCIEKMRDCYNFNDEKTEIWLENRNKIFSTEVCIRTKDENGTEIAMTRYAEELVKE